MFGQSNTPFGGGGGGFGQTNTPAFGSPAPGGGFGAPAPPAFGGGGFGSPAPAPGGFGGFGAAPTPAAPSGFGGGSAFGAPAPSAFGSAPAGNTPFGSPPATAFGQPPAPSTGLFGAPAPGGGLFGNPAPAPAAFGATNTGFGGGGGFGQSSTTNTGFGGGSAFGGQPAAAPATGLFGAAPAPPAFGATTNTGFGAPASTFGSPSPAPGMFGQPAAAPGGSIFGQPAAAGGGQGGTKVAPFQPTGRQDGTTNITLHSITAMQAYEQKSFEELRLEDYSQGNRGTGGAPPAAGAGFGGFTPAPARSTGLFGGGGSTFGGQAPAAPGFGTTGAFGSPTPAPATGFGFGGAAPAPAPFGAPAPATGAFGSTGFAAKPPTTGLFGSPAATPGSSLFGAPASAAPSTGLFGAPTPAAPAGGSLFGSTPAAPAGGSLFGQPPAAAPAPGAFGSTGFSSATGGFGATGFGSASPAPTGLFGAPSAPSTFGQPASSSLFGAPTPAAGSSLFGAKPPVTPGMFGAPASAPPSSFGQPATPSLFGQQIAVPQMPPTPAAGTVIPPVANEILVSQMKAMEEQRKELEKYNVWRDKSSTSAAIVPVSQPPSDSLNSVTPIRASYSPYRASPKSRTQIRPRGFSTPAKKESPSLSRLGSNGKRHVLTPDVVAASSVTRLVIKSNSRPKIKLLLDNKPSDESKSEQPQLRASPGTGRDEPPSGTPQGSASKTPTNGNRGYDYYQQVIASPGDEAAGRSPRPNLAPKLSKIGYKCTPNVQILQTLSGEDLAAVAGFSIERVGFGKIEWEGAVDVRGADLDRIALIEEKAVSMYVEDEKQNNKPPVGSKLNRPAILTWYNIFPKDGGADADEEAKKKFANFVEKKTSRIGATFISYDPDSGIWKIRVEHFSRYGLDDEDEDDEMDEEPEAEQETTVNFDSGESGGLSPDRSRIALKNRQATPFTKGVRWMEDIDGDEDETALVSDMEMGDESAKVLDEAEVAYANIYEMLNVKAKQVQQPQIVADFVDEGEDSSYDMASSRHQMMPTEDELLAASSAPGICFKIASEAGVKSSSTDFGFRMGRSFRPGWGPDGSFVTFDPSKGRLVRRRPVFTQDGGGKNADLLKVHRETSERSFSSARCTQFTHSQDGSIQKALKMYSTPTPANDASVAKQAFSLLSCLWPDKGTAGSGTLAVFGDDSALSEYDLEQRRICAVSQWLVNSCSDEVDEDIMQAKQQKDLHWALLCAVSGGDIEKACSIASDSGFLHLTSILAAGPAGREDVLKSIHQWTDKGSIVPEHLLRIYFMIGGDEKMEEDVFKKGLSSWDWRRRLAMRMAYDSSGLQPSVEKLIEGYESSLAAGVAPYPNPSYMARKSREEIQCVLYRLLRLGHGNPNIPLSEIIAPSGHTRDVHDFSLAFHLASSLTGIGMSSPLPSGQEQILVDGYMAQLLNSGCWEWAVYVSLYSMNTSKSDYDGWKKTRAKSLVLQNFRDDTPPSAEKRRFLQELGVPSEWFEEAQALRCAVSGDAFGYIKHMAAFDPSEACKSLEQVVIPNILFLNRSKVKETLALVDVFASAENNLVSAVVDFFHVYQNIHMLERAPRSERDASIPALMQACSTVEQILKAYRTGDEKRQGPALGIVPDSKRVPMESFLAEGLAQISLFKLQLKALEAGIPVSSIASQIMKLTTPDDFSGHGITSRDNMLRWLM